MDTADVLDVTEETEMKDQEERDAEGAKEGEWWHEEGNKFFSIY